MNTSILDSIKKRLGYNPDYDAFDTDVIDLINTYLSSAYQIGGCSKCRITGRSETWSITSDKAEQVDLLKTYIYGKVKLVFDPPSNSTVLQALTESVKETEFRLHGYGNFTFSEEENG